jgi:hypothetical protein
VNLVLPSQRAAVCVSLHLSAFELVLILESAYSQYNLVPVYPDIEFYTPNAAALAQTTALCSTLDSCSQCVMANGFCQWNAVTATCGPSPNPLAEGSSVFTRDGRVYSVISPFNVSLCPGMKQKLTFLTPTF